MMGIKFQIPNKYDTVLYKILRNVISADGTYKITNEEVLNNKGVAFFSKEFYSATEFIRLIKNRKHYPIFLILQFYRQNSNENKIICYDDFSKKDFDLKLCIVDNIFVDVYSKDKKVLEKIMKNALENSFTNIDEMIDKSS